MCVVRCLSVSGSTLSTAAERSSRQLSGAVFCGGVRERLDCHKWAMELERGNDDDGGKVINAIKITHYGSNGHSYCISNVKKGEGNFTRCVCKNKLWKRL